MSDVTNMLFSNSSLFIYTAEYICGDGWWLDDSGHNWWNRKDKFPYNAIYLTKVGCFDLKINGVWYHIKPHQLVFIPAGSELEFFFDGKGSLEKYFVHFDLNYGVGALCDCFITPCLSSPDDETRIEELFKALICHTRAKQEPSSAIAANGTMLSLVAEMIRQTNSKFTNPKSSLPKEMREVISYIETNLCSQIPVSVLAEKAGYSLTYFTKKFKRAFGCTPTDYIFNLKIERAESMLRDKKMSIAEIAYALGFSGTSYFSNFFKIKTGLSPAYYRKQTRSE